MKKHNLASDTQTAYPTKNGYTIIPNEDLRLLLICLEALGRIFKACRFRCYRGTIIAGTVARIMAEDFGEDYKAARRTVGRRARVYLYDEYDMPVLRAMLGRKRK